MGEIKLRLLVRIVNEEEGRECKRTVMAYEYTCERSGLDKVEAKQNGTHPYLLLRLLVRDDEMRRRQHQCPPLLGASLCYFNVFHLRSS